MDTLVQLYSVRNLTLVPVVINPKMVSSVTPSGVENPIKEVLDKRTCDVVLSTGEKIRVVGDLSYVLEKLLSQSSKQILKG